MITKDKVQWSILPSVQEFLLGGIDNIESIDNLMQGMVDNMVELCALQSTYGLDIDTCNNINNVMSNCSDVYELFKKIKIEMERELN